MDTGVKQDPWDWRDQEDDRLSHCSSAGPTPPLQPGVPPLPPAYMPTEPGAGHHQYAHPPAWLPHQQPPTWYGGPPPPGYHGYPGVAGQYGAHTDSHHHPAVQPPQPRYFFIRSQLNDMVLDVRDGNPAPGTQVITWHKKMEASVNQLWFEDADKSTIRSKLHGMCLEITGGGCLVVRPYEPANNNQKLRLTDDTVQVCGRPGNVLDIARSNKSAGAMVVSYKQHGKKNQKWKFDYLDEFGRDTSQPRKFYLRSDLNHKVLDVAGENQQPGAQAIMYPRKPAKCLNQLWYTSDKGVIFSALNNFTLDSSGGSLTMQPYSPSNKHQQWTVRGRQLVNTQFPNQCLDIKAASMADGAQIIVWKDNGNANQQWHVDHV